MQWLKEGNVRFSSGRPSQPHQTLVRAKELATGQHPFATILGCSYSRVPPEVIFDQGLGDLFIVRVAGNVISDEVLGSIEYAALHLGTSAFLVLGHEDCGAVKAALSSSQEKTAEPAAIQALLAHIDSAIHGAQLPAASVDRVTKAVEVNAKHSAAQLKTALQDRHLAAEAIVQTAIYQVGSGRVRWL
jgi:carbonic anhydrase